MPPNIAITNDVYMRRPGIVTPEDEEILKHASRVLSIAEFLEVADDLPSEECPPEPVPGLFKLTPDQLQDMGFAASRTASEFSKHARLILTSERAKEVRELRCDQRHSWRALATECHRRWEGRWEPPSNQLMGMELCECAAQMLDENAHEMPWNDL